MTYTQLTARYNGFTGAPGWIRMKFFGSLTVADANTAAANFRAFLNPVTTYSPTGSSISYDSTAAIYDDEGTQTGEITLTVVPAASTGSSAVAYAGGSGAVVNWTTGAFHLGRKVRGRTFLVPLTSAAFQTDGTLLATAQTTIQGAASTFATSSPTPVVFSRKPNGSGGFSSLTAVVTGATVPDRSAILRSRRD
ncbi:MAG TPA: hypothetical protein VIT62_04120 [Lysobacter sp.]